MKDPFKYIFILLSGFVCQTCSKTTKISVRVMDYALNEPVETTKVVLVERKESGTFQSNASCSEIASTITDAEGRCSFDKNKLKTTSKYQYYLANTKSYGKVKTYPCGGKTSGFIKPGWTSEEQIEVGTLRLIGGIYLLS